MVSMRDGYKNLAKKLGTNEGSLGLTKWSQGKLNASSLEDIYNDGSLGYIICTAPVFDAFLTGITTDNKEIEDLFTSHTKSMIQAISISRALGASVYMMGDSPKVLTLNEVVIHEVELNPERDDFLEPKSIYLTSLNTEIKDYIFISQESTNDFKSNNFGAGRSIISSCSTALIRYDNSLTNASDIINQLNQTVIHMKDLNELIIDSREEDIVERLALINLLKSNNSTILIDGEDSFTNISKSLSGVRDVITENAISLCAITKMPYSRLFGRTVTGLSSGNDTELKSYYDTVVTDIRRFYIRDIFNQILDFHGAKGEWEFKPIYKESPLDIEKTREIKIKNDLALFEIGAIDLTELKKLLI